MSDLLETRLYPTLFGLGVLRQRRSSLIVSTAALYDKLGPGLYRKCLPHFKYFDNVGPVPGPLESFLAAKAKQGVL